MRTQNRDYNNVGFKGNAVTQRENGSTRVGEYYGFFAGDDAQEVVGKIRGIGSGVMFGGKR